MSRSSGRVILVCGSRAWMDGAAVYAALDELRPDLVVHGAAFGADSCADSCAAGWCNVRGVEQRRYPADWYRHGRTMCHDLASWAVLLESHPELFRNATRHTALSSVYRRVAAWVAVPRADDSDRTGCTNIAVEAPRMPQDEPEEES